MSDGHSALYRAMFHRDNRQGRSAPTPDGSPTESRYVLCVIALSMGGPASPFRESGAVSAVCEEL
jgi:hypothetical protein